MKKILVLGGPHFSGSGWFNVYWTMERIQKGEPISVIHPDASYSFVAHKKGPCLDAGPFFSFIMFLTKHALPCR